MTRCYHAGDLTIGSTLDLPGLPRASRSRVSWRFRLAGPRQVPNTAPWYHHWRLPGRSRPWMSVGRVGSRHLIRFPGAGRFLIDNRRRLVLGRADTGASRGTFTRMLVGQILPLLMGGSGRLVIHASAVETAGGVVAFVGPTGYGKSTLAAFLARSHHPLVTDDCLLVNLDGKKCRAIPVHTGLRLWPDQARMLLGSRTAGHPASGPLKRLLDPEAAGMTIGRKTARLVRIYLLSSPEDAVTGVSVGRITARDAAIDLIRSIFQVGFDEPAGLRETFDLLADLVTRVPVRRLEYPRALGVLPRVERAVVADLVA